MVTCDTPTLNSKFWSICSHLIYSCIYSTFCTTWLSWSPVPRPVPVSPGWWVDPLAQLSNESGQNMRGLGFYSRLTLNSFTIYDMGDNSGTVGSVRHGQPSKFEKEKEPHTSVPEHTCEGGFNPHQKRRMSWSVLPLPVPVSHRLMGWPFGSAI